MGAPFALNAKTALPTPPATRLQAVFAPDISVVIPARDEQENIGKLVSEIALALKPVCSFEVVLVDDGSTDQTYEVFLQALARCQSDGIALRHAESMGQSTALLTGVRNARGHYVVTIDGDGQNDPADIPSLFAMVASTTTQDFCIAGYRKHRNDTAWRKIQSRIANRVRNALIHDGIPDTGCGLKLIPRATYLQLPYFDHMHRFLPALIRRMGGENQVVVVNHRFRLAGQSKYTVWNRLWAGIVDLCGVMWLNRRARIPVLAARQIMQEAGHEIAD